MAEEAGFNPFGGMDMSSMLMAIAFNQSPILRPLTPLLIQGAREGRRNAQSQQLVQGLGEIHQFMQAGDFAGAEGKLGEISKFVTPGSESLIQSTMTNITKAKAQKQAGEAFTQLGQIGNLPPERRGEALNILLPKLMGMPGVNTSDVVGATNILVPQLESKIDQGAGVATFANPRTGQIGQTQFTPATSPSEAKKFEEGLARMGVPMSTWVALSNSPEEGNKALAAQIAQKAVGAQDTAALTQQQAQTNIQVAGQKQAASHSAAVHGAEQRRTFLANERNRLPSDVMQEQLRGAGLPIKPISQYTQQEVQLGQLHGVNLQGLLATTKEQARAAAEISIATNKPLRDEATRYIHPETLQNPPSSFTPGKAEEASYVPLKETDQKNLKEVRREVGRYVGALRKVRQLVNENPDIWFEKKTGGVSEATRQAGQMWLAGQVGRIDPKRREVFAQLDAIKAGRASYARALGEVGNLTEVEQALQVEGWLEPGFKDATLARLDTMENILTEQTNKLFESYRLKAPFEGKATASPSKPMTIDEVLQKYGPKPK